jgi:hypothetical protein
MGLGNVANHTLATVASVERRGPVKGPLGYGRIRMRYTFNILNAVRSEPTNINFPVDEVFDGSYGPPSERLLP